MDAGDLDSILIPNDTTWLEEETAILSRQCSYPFRPPANNCLPFSGFPELELTLGEAVFKYNESVLSQKKVQKYFAVELNDVAAYNKRRGELIFQCKDLNGRIREWNTKSKALWEAYAK